MFGKWRKPKAKVKRSITKTKVVLTVHMGRNSFQRTFLDQEFKFRDEAFVTPSSTMAEKWMAACNEKGFMWDGNKIFYPWSLMTKVEMAMTQWQEEVEE